MCIYIYAFRPKSSIVWWLRVLLAKFTDYTKGGEVVKELSLSSLLKFEVWSCESKFLRVFIYRSQYWIGSATDNCITFSMGCVALVMFVYIFWYSRRGRQPHRQILRCHASKKMCIYIYSKVISRLDRISSKILNKFASYYLYTVDTNNLALQYIIQSQSNRISDEPFREMR